MMAAVGCAAGTLVLRRPHHTGQDDFFPYDPGEVWRISRSCPASNAEGKRHLPADPVHFVALAMGLRILRDSILPDHPLNVCG